MVDELRSVCNDQAGSAGDGELLSGTFQDIKRKIIRRVLKEEGWNKSRTARRLGIDRMTVDRFGEEIEPK
jgi:transcriptional regulator with GAF, ATPase, and Fis domain